MHSSWGMTPLLSATVTVTVMSGHLQRLSTSTNHADDDFSGTAGIVVPSDPRLLSRLLTDNRTALDHFRSPNSSSAALPAPAILDSPAVDELNLLPVCGPEVVDDDQFTSGSAETASSRSGKDNGSDENGDVIGTCVAETSDAGVFEVRVIKGAVGLGFCIEGGRGSLTGDRPITVKRLFRGILYLSLVFTVAGYFT